MSRVRVLPAPSNGSNLPMVGAVISHDEYGIVSDLEGVPKSVRDSLDKLGLLTNAEAD